MRRRFSWKPSTSFLIFLSFIVIVVSGLVLYVAPPGRVANWTRWQLGPLDKAQWQALHTAFALVFLGGALLHLVFNWRVLLAYLRTRLHTGTSHRREFAVAAAVTLVALGLTWADLPPFSTVVALGETAKNSWIAPEAEPPVPHAEGLTLERLAGVVQQPLDALLARLQQQGVQGAAADRTVGEIAAMNRLSPHDLYTRMRVDAAPPRVNVEAGLGRKTVHQVCRELGLDVDEGLRRLAAAGLQASPEDAMRTLAAAHGRSPHDLLAILRGQ